MIWSKEGLNCLYLRSNPSLLWFMPPPSTSAWSSSEYWFSTRGYYAPLQGITRQHLQTFSIIWDWRGRVLLASWVEARDATKPPPTHRTASTKKDYQAQNVNSAEAEKPWVSQMNYNSVRTPLVVQKPPYTSVNPESQWIPSLNTRASSGIGGL